MRCRAALLALVLLTLPLTCFAQTEAVTSNVLQRVFMIKYGDNVGTGFTIDVDNKQYLISAKHLLANLSESDQIEVFHDSQWKSLKVSRIDLENPRVDIIVLAPSLQLSPPLELQPSIGNILLSQNVFFLGFPFGMKEDVKALNNYFPLPLVKKGIVSSLAFANKDEKMLYVDGYNNPGFSGGPIVFFDWYEKKLKVAAVVSAYRNQLADVYDKGQATAFKAAMNSGILVGYTIDAAIDAIKKKPIGVPIKIK